MKNSFSLDILKKLRKLEQGCLPDLSEQLAGKYVKNSNLVDRKLKGQFFTPKPVALFMTSLFTFSRKANISVLDPGAGVGMLSVAFCERILNSSRKFSLSIDTYESDSELVPFLLKNLNKCKSILEKKGHKFNFRVLQTDFILNNPNYINKITLFKTAEPLRNYDFIISNPPYYKLNKSSPQTRIMQEFVSGQPNIYSFFMALALGMLKPEGEMVFITPRSFCSGPYFRRFRKWLLENGIINSIHIFESRRDVFNKSDVLQENIIIKITPRVGKLRERKVFITKSQDSSFFDLDALPIDYQDILHHKNGDVFIKIPTSELDIKIQHLINTWKYTLKDFGIKVSTGPVVSFRAKEFLSQEVRNKAVPLLWMHNINNMEVIWPLQKKNKENAIVVESNTKSLLLPVNNYVLVKRFSSKEQKRRLYAGVLLKSTFNFDRVGIENHLNYIYKFNSMLSDNEAYGIAGILNTSLMDIFFRMLNGVTQVNAQDIDNLPFPSLENIEKVGKSIRKVMPLVGEDLDNVVFNNLGITDKVIESLKEVYSKNGKN